MRIYRILAALMALCLLLASAAMAEDAPGGILSESVDLAVPEEELELVGAPEDGGYADFVGDVGVSASDEGDFVIKNGVLTRYTGQGGDVVIPASVTRIGDGVFRTGGVKSVQCEAGSQLTTIGYRAFFGNTSLKSVILPDSVTTLGVEVFYLSFLEEITLSKSLTEIPDTTFAYSNITSIVIPEGVTRIGKDAFAECSSLKSIVLPGSLTEIGDSAFKNCSALTSIVLPDGLTSLGVGAFSGCAALASVNFPKQLTTINASAFSGCGMTSLSVPDNVTTIGDSAFSGCKDLVSAILPDSVTTLGTGVLSGCAALESVTLPKGIAAIPERTFRESGLKSYAVPQSVTTIGTSAFRGCAQLASIDIPEGVTDIGESAFAECGALKQVTLPKAITTINTMTFSKCAALESIEVPDGVWGIGQQAFEFCTSLKTVVLPESVTAIRSLAFRGCTGLETIIIPGKDVTFNFYSSQNVTPFSNCSKDMIIVCTTGSTVEKFARENGIAYGYIKPTEPTGIALSETKTVDSKMGKTLTLTAILEPEGIETTLTWKSSDPKVATVDNGVVTPVAPGTAVISATTANNLTASVTVRVSRSDDESPDGPISLASAEVAVKNATYNGKAREPAVTVSLDGKALEQGTDYSVTYSNNKAVGLATVTVTGTGDYTGTARGSFKINPKKVSGLKLKAGAKKLTATWKKVGGVSGYQLQYGLKKSFSGAKKLTVKKASTVKATIKGLKAGKTYYVHIRAYKTVKGVKYWSAWSAAVKKKTK